MREKNEKFFGFTFANGSPELISREINFRVYKTRSQRKAYIFEKKRKKENEKNNNIFILKSKLFLA